MKHCDKMAQLAQIPIQHFPQSFSDLIDCDCRRLAERAEDLNRSTTAVTAEQADDLARALVAIRALLGRIE